MSEWYEVAFDRFYPLLYGHRDADEARRAASSFAPSLAGFGPSLDLACGAGRYMAALAEYGLDMIGVDLSPYLLARAAQEAGLAGRLVRGDMRSLPFGGGVFASAVNMFTSFGYFSDDDENRAVLAEVARVLQPSGRFLIDYMNTTRVTGEGLGRTSRVQDGYTIDEDRRVEGAGRYLVKHVRVDGGDDDSRLEYDERVRLFTPQELDDMLETAGLDVLERYGDYDRGEFDPARSDRLIALCERREGV